MELTGEQTKTLGKYVEIQQTHAPRPIWQILVSLTTEKPTAYLVARNEVEQGTTWRVLWLTSTALVYAEASKQIPDWDIDSHYSDADQVAGWLRPLTAVRRLSVEAMSPGQRGHGNSWVWRVGTRVHFDDGGSVDLPLFGGAPRQHESKDVEAFVEQLRAACSL